MSYKNNLILEEKFNIETIENNCIKFWKEDNTYKFDKTRDRNDTFAIDTPPPTVSGSLHIGHIMSYTQADILARYQRMTGKTVFFPIGWDDNGLPTERRVQNYFNIKCDTDIKYIEDFTPIHKDKFEEPQKHISRKNFIEACQNLIEKDEIIFESIFRKMGFSYDWNLKYSTISKTAIEVAQKNFIDLYKSGNVFMKNSPTMWDVTFGTAVAQAEIEDKTINGYFHDIKFTTEEGTNFVIATTRPEYLPACIAIVANPNDERYKYLIGKTAITPLFNTKVKIFGDIHADSEKGTGIMMVCTFGDSEDIKFWKANNLPLKQIIGKNGKIIETDFLKDNKYYNELIGLPIKVARKKIIEQLKENEYLVSEPRPISHSVKFYEKGDEPIEIITSRQWFIKLMDKKDKLKEMGNKVNWFPQHMGLRLQNWTDGLNQDWAISRQRFFGVPFPVWYKLDKNKNPIYEEPILSNKLPCDPSIDCPEEFSEDKRGKENGFIAESDVMDTWAISSLTPLIAEKLANTEIGTFDARPQAHDIIRTWAFYTIAQSLLSKNTIPWKQAWISGFVLDPDRKKMSKSKGNVITPDQILSKYGSDAVRLWAASGKFGTDSTADEKFMDQKRKLVMKFYNASKFVFNFKENLDRQEISNKVDLSFISKLQKAIFDCNKSFIENDYTGALNLTEKIFWDFCDNYIEIVKTRAYSGDISALTSLRFIILVFCTMFAPFIPFITEEIWQTSPYKLNDQFIQLSKESDSIHRNLYPSYWKYFKDKEIIENNIINYDNLSDLIGEIRKIKTENEKSVKYPIEKLSIKNNEFLKNAEEDIKNVLNVSNIIFNEENTASTLIWGELDKKD